MQGADVGGRRAEPARASPGCRAGVNRFTNYRPKLGRRPPLYRPSFARLPLVYWRVARRFLITSFRRAPPEPCPKCDRVHFKQKICSTPWRIWNSATFGRSTISAGDRWICDVGIRNDYSTLKMDGWVEIGWYVAHRVPVAQWRFPPTYKILGWHVLVFGEICTRGSLPLNKCL